MLVCLILAPGRDAGAHGPPCAFDRIEQALIRPALAPLCGSIGTVRRLKATLPLAPDDLAELLAADLVLYDLSQDDGPAGYALGLRHALRRRHTLLIRGTRGSQVAPAASGAGHRAPGPEGVLDYDLDEPATAVGALQAWVDSCLRSLHGADSPVYLLMPTLREATASQLGLAPVEQLRAVVCAEARGDRGALRLQAETLQGPDHDSPVLRALACAQARLGDAEGACRSWQRLVEQGVADAEAELGLARQHLVLHTQRGGPHHLEAAEQALTRLPSLPGFATLPAADAAEAAALAAQVRLHQWRRAWQGQPNPRERRRRAACAALLSLPSAFLHAQRMDLHAVPAAMAALHAARTLAVLSADDDTATRLHARPADARDTLCLIERDTECLRMLVTLALQRLDQLQAPGSAMLAALARAELRWLDATESSHPEQAAGRVRDALTAAAPSPGDAAGLALARALRERLEDAAALGLDAVAASVLVGLGGWGAAPHFTAPHHVVLALDGEAAAQAPADTRGVGPAPDTAEALTRRLRTLGGSPGTTRLVAAARTTWEQQVRHAADTLGWSVDTLGAWDEPPPAPAPRARRWMMHAAAALAPASLSLLLPTGCAAAIAAAWLDEARELLGPGVLVELLP